MGRILCVARAWLPRPGQSLPPVMQISCYRDSIWVSLPSSPSLSPSLLQVSSLCSEQVMVKKERTQLIFETERERERKKERRREGEREREKREKGFALTKPLDALMEPTTVTCNRCSSQRGTANVPTHLHIQGRNILHDMNFSFLSLFPFQRWGRHASASRAAMDGTASIELSAADFKSKQIQKTKKNAPLPARVRAIIISPLSLDQCDGFN